MLSLKQAETPGMAEKLVAAFAVEALGGQRGLDVIRPLESPFASRIIQKRICME